MPELPEVEWIRRELDARLTGLTLASVSGQFAPREAVGLTVESVDRRGKYLLVSFDPGAVVIHLGMTGQVHLDGIERRHERSRMNFGALTVTFVDPRGFGSVSWLDGHDTTLHHGLLARLGQEPLDEAFDVERAARILEGRDTPVKALLLDQRAIAGVGNYIADESLWRARVSPQARKITRVQARRLVKAVREVVADSLERGGVSIRDYQHADGSLGSMQDALAVYGRAGHECLECGRMLEKSVVAGRGTTWCPSCQKR